MQDWYERPNWNSFRITFSAAVGQLNIAINRIGTALANLFPVRIPELPPSRGPRFPLDLTTCRVPPQLHHPNESRPFRQPVLARTLARPREPSTRRRGPPLLRLA
jgi:hypothetical protein